MKKPKRALVSQNKTFRQKNTQTLPRNTRKNKIHTMQTLSPHYGLKSFT